MRFSALDKLPENVVETSASFYYMENENIIHVINKPCTMHSKEDAEENISLLHEMSKGSPRLILIDVTNIKSIEREARELYASEGANLVRAVALLTHSIVGQIVGNFFIGFNKPTVPTKLFVNEKLAREWLIKQL